MTPKTAGGYSGETINQILGISGAAWATVVAEALTVAILFVQLQRRMRES